MRVQPSLPLVNGQIFRQESPFDDHVLPCPKHWITSAGTLLSVGPCRGVVEVKLVASIRSLSSRWVAWAFAAAYLMVSAVVGVVLLTMPKASPAESPAAIAIPAPEIM